MKWLSWLWPARQRSAASPQAPRPEGPSDDNTTAVSEFQPSVQPAEIPTAAETGAGGQSALAWLLDCPWLTENRLSPDEETALAALDQTLALPALPDNLLPRAASLMPQLIALVRQTDLPVPAIAERVGKDAVLAAEVMRLATSPYYQQQGKVENLEQAITLIGLQGLQTVMARVLLKPIYQGSTGPWSSRAAGALWEHSEALARHTAILATPAGQPVFDGYLAGMLHDTGWTVALSVLDRAAIPLSLPPSTAFAIALDDRVHRLFGLCAQRWDITPGFLAFAQDARQNGPLAGRHPLAAVLRLAHRQCMEELSPTSFAPLDVPS